MSISYNKQTKTFTLQTAETSYQMQVDQYDRLRHLYYGRRIDGDRMDCLYLPADRGGFSPDYYETALYRGAASPDMLPQEYTGFNIGDFRLSCLEVTAEGGPLGVDFHYTGYQIKRGKYTLEGLPAAYGTEDEAETLIILLEDTVLGLGLELLYGVFEQQDMITRAARLINVGKQNVILGKAASMCLDIPFGKWELLHFHGRHAMERQPERRPLLNGIQTVASKRGASSHHHNPFIILCDSQTNEDTGDCFGSMLVYSGSYRMDVELDSLGSVRMVCGIHDELFRWILHPCESFTTPEVLLTFTHQGLTALSQRYHRFLRGNICRGKFSHIRRPILINNWEATYFQFTKEKIISIAEQAAKLGVEMLVLDDGWFGKRDDDHSGLGDWYVNEKKLPGGLDPLIDRIHSLGMRFGLWIEPEMVCEDSALYRAHPDWALTLPGRKPALGRCQLTLDLSRGDVVDYLTEVFSKLLREHAIDYIKWDMNRNMSDVHSYAMPPERQGEVSHRYMLGVYRLAARLTSAFPDVLFEGCAGGGGRFDAGMLAYFPQIWCSDDSDAIERLSIQYGTSFGYPVSAVGSHVSASPNHQTGRATPLGTRAVVAMSGTFGYELDLNTLTEEEKAEVREQICYFKTHYDLIQDGDYYRLTGISGDFTAWQFVSPDKTEALVSFVLSHPRPNAVPTHFALKGLEEHARYRIEDCRVYGTRGTPSSEENSASVLTGKELSGAALMYAGLTLPQMFGDAPSAQIYLRKV